MKIQAKGLGTGKARTKLEDSFTHKYQASKLLPRMEQECKES